MIKNYLKVLTGLMLIFAADVKAQVLFSEPFTNSLGGTTAMNGSSGNWIWSGSCSRSALTGHTTNGHALFSGSGCQFGNGGNVVSGDLNTPGISIGPLGAILSFNYSIQNECSAFSTNCTYDVLRLQVSTNGGASYTTLMSSNTSPGGFSVNASGWIPVSYTLNAATYGNQSVIVRFNFHSLDGVGNAYDGIYVDDINVIGIQPCSGTPAANAIVPSTTLVCPGYGNAVISHTTGYSVGGLVYTWMSSTQSAVGPYTPISNSNVGTYPTTTLNVPTYYQSVITCTNSNQSYTTAPVLINVDGVTISQVPYFEGFEGIVNTNQLPNCSWSATNPTVIARTYTATQSQQRTARTGNKFASFYYFPSGTNYFFTNGIQLYAGVTYSASLWYATNYYAELNWSDMSIMLGTSQSTTGLTLIKSTNGAATSNFYKSLSNTFTVATSGIYYVAIKGTSTNGCCAYHLNWDDLMIEIPCSLNTPTIGVTANSSTICAGDPVILTATGADNYTWSHGPTGSPITEMPSQNIMYTVSGTNTITGCSNTQNQVIVVNPAPMLTVFADAPSICAGSPVVITAVGADTYLWSGNLGTNNYVTVSPTITTTYSVFGSNSYGCQVQSSQVITVNALPNVTGFADRTEICKGEQATLTGGGASTYEWAANTLYVQSAQAMVSPNVSTTYTVTGTNTNGCRNSATVFLTVQQCVGLNESTTTLSGVKVYPNPTGGLFTVEVSGSTEKTVEVIDVTGRIVISNQSSDELMNININNLANGIYYVKIQSADAVETIKIIKN